MIGAKNDANGQPMDIEIRDASHFKEDRDKEMAAMGLETASDNEIYNAWKIENEENPFVVKTISEVKAEEGDDSKGNDADEKEAASEKTEDTDSLTEKSEQSDAPAGEEAGSTSQKAVDAGVEAVVAVFDLANLSKGKKSGEKTLETQDKAEEPKIETVEEFLEGVKSAAPLEAGGIDPKEQQPERDENMFEKESGIAFERPSEYQPPIVPMNTPFTRIPRLESVNAEEYHKEYDELKKTLPKNQFYAQRFSSANITQPFVETAKPITASPEPAVEQTDNGDSSDGSEKRFGRNRRNKNKLKEKSAESQGDSTFEYYTGYEEADDPFSVQNPDEEQPSQPLEQPSQPENEPPAAPTEEPQAPVEEPAVEEPEQSPVQPEVVPDTPTPAAPSTSETKKEVSRTAYDDNDGSGHGYWEILYSDGSVAYVKY